MTKRPFAFVPLPDARSARKPRRRGLTMMIDAGLPLGYQRDLLAVAGAYVDLAKIKTGSARLYAEADLKKKLAQYRARKVKPFIGGQFHELVFALQGEKALPRFYKEARRVGFTTIEISDNVIPLSARQRDAQIRGAIEAGLEVFGEVGSKERKSDVGALIGQAEACFAAGAALVLVEAAELVRDGRPDRRMIDRLRAGLDMSRVMIELPGPWISGVRACDIEDLKKMLIHEIGPDVNLANVKPEDLIDLEASRTGLGVAGPLKDMLPARLAAE